MTAVLIIYILELEAAEDSRAGTVTATDLNKGNLQFKVDQVAAAFLHRHIQDQILHRVTDQEQVAHPMDAQLMVDIRPILEAAEDNRVEPATVVDLNRDNQPADQVAAAAFLHRHIRAQILHRTTDQEQVAHPMDVHLMFDIQLMRDPEVQLEHILVPQAVFRRHIQVQILHKAKDQE